MVCRRALFLMLVTVSMAAGPSAKAGTMILEFGLESVPVTSFTVQAGGGEVDVEVYVRATDDTLTTLQTYGLHSAHVKLVINDGTVATVQDVTDIEHNPVFDDAIWLRKSVTETATELREAVDDIGPAPSPYVKPDDSGRIWLGTFTYTGGSVGTTTINVTEWDPDPEYDDFLYWDSVQGKYVSLDDQIVDGTADLMAVPELSSFGLALVMLGLASVVIAYRTLAASLRKSVGRLLRLPLQTCG